MKELGDVTVGQSGSDGELGHLVQFVADRLAAERRQAYCGDHRPQVTCTCDLPVMRRLDALERVLAVTVDEIRRSDAGRSSALARAVLLNLATAWRSHPQYGAWSADSELDR